MCRPFGWWCSMIKMEARDTRAECRHAPWHAFQEPWSFLTKTKSLCVTPRAIHWYIVLIDRDGKLKTIRNDGTLQQIWPGGDLDTQLRKWYCFRIQSDREETRQWLIWVTRSNPSFTQRGLSDHEVYHMIQHRVRWNNNTASTWSQRGQHMTSCQRLIRVLSDGDSYAYLIVMAVRTRKALTVAQCSYLLIVKWESISIGWSRLSSRQD